jgi:hypothetical protein
MVIGSIDLFQVVVCFAVLLAELAVVCAIGLGWSALVNRTSGSTLLTYATVLTLSVLTPVAFGLVSPLVDHLPYYGQTYALPGDVKEAWVKAGRAGLSVQPPLDQCTWRTGRDLVWRSDHIWWLLAPNPVVIVADAAPLPAIGRSHPDVYARHNSDEDVLYLLRWAVISLRKGPEAETAEYPCTLSGASALDDVLADVLGARPENSDQGPVWPWGLGFSLLLGGFFFWVAVRRLSVPYGELPKGTRVA